MSEYGASLIEIETEWTDPMLLLFYNRIVDRHNQQARSLNGEKPESKNRMSLGDLIERVKT